MADPTPRVKACVKSILKDHTSQFQFTTLLNNSINDAFQVDGYDNRPLDVSSLDINDFVMRLLKTRRFYDNLLVSLNLNLNPDCLNIYNRNLNKNFKLVVQNEPVLGQLHRFFDDNFLHIKDWPPQDFLPILKFFEACDLLDELNRILIQVLIRKIKNFITENFTSVWSVPTLDKLNEFIKFRIYPSIEYIFGNIGLKIAFSDLVKIGYNELTSLRINEIYRIIMNYPVSAVSLKELNKCLNYHSYHQAYYNSSDNVGHYQRNKLVELFTKETKSNLLNSGITTIHLIQSYIKIIKGFLILDPKGVLLDKVIRPVRRYLKTRDDIINKLVLGLLDKEPQLADLAQELRDTEKNSKLLKNFDDFNDLNWVPDPIDALPDFKKFKINDIIQSLISIFDSKDIFIVEFTKLFGNKLITNEEDLETILNLINLLKLRFGKNEFFNLDIMVEDFVNSKSNNVSLNGTNFHLLVLSHLYWSDILEESSFKLHPKLSDMFEAYNTDVYRAADPSRYLKAIPNFGSIMLDVNNKLYDVTLDKASVLFMFDDHQNSVPVSQICDTLEMSEYMVSKCLEFWCNEDIIVKLTPTLYSINE